MSQQASDLGKRDLSRETLVAWAAGFFEGEGCYYLRRSLTPAIQIQNCDIEVLRRFHEIVGEGRINGPYTKPFKDGYTRKPRWIWGAEDKAALRVYRMLEPYLSTRRRERGAEVFAPAIRREALAS